MESKYAHIRHLPVTYMPNSDKSFTVSLNGLLVARIIPEGETSFKVCFTNVASDEIQCSDKRQCDVEIRKRCFDFLIVCIDPVHAAATATIVKEKLSFLGIQEAKNDVTGTTYDLTGQ